VTRPRRFGPPGLRPGPRIGQALGARALFAIGLSAVGSSIYFALGLVAGEALGLTPVAFVIAGGFFVVTMMSYIEGNSLHPERGGASTFARYAFNELWSFVAGWAILLDYLIVMAIAAFAIPHYLAAFVGVAGDPVVEVVIAAAAIVAVAVLNIRGLSAERLRIVLRVGIVNLVLLVVVMVLGLALMFDPDLVLDSIDLGSAPRWEDFIFATVIAMAALTGIEAASGLAAEIRPRPAALRRIVPIASAVLLVIFLGMSLVALVSVPVIGGSTELAGPAAEAPVLEIVSRYEPRWLGETLGHLVAVTASVVLLQALNTGMLGLSRLVYSLATNRQVPSAVGKLHAERSTPYVAIVLAAIAAIALVLPADIDFLAGIFAFGATLTFVLAHVSVIRMRFREPDLRRAYRVPFSVPLRGASVPIPSLLGAIAAAAAFVSVIVLHDGARILGGLWMAAGVALYVVYRRTQDEPIFERCVVPPEALRDRLSVEYGSILVPVFGNALDDDIVGTAGRLAAEEREAGEGGPVIEALFVLEMPMSLPLDARVPDERIAAARRALARAKAVGEEYEGVEVATATQRSRSAGAAIVEEARRRGVEAIVLAAEEPTRIRGGALLGGLGGPRDRFVGDLTRYVLEKAPCRVILTAAPAGEEGVRDAVAP